MLKVFILVTFFLLQSLNLKLANSFEVSALVSVNDVIITSFDLEERIKISKISNPEDFKNSQLEEVKKSTLERLVQEELLFKMANDNNFIVSEAEIEESIKFISSENIHLKNKNLQVLFGTYGYQSFKNQVKGEIIFNAVLGSYLKDKLNFSEDELGQFLNSYNLENNKKITKSEAKKILTSVRISEAQQNLIKNLHENSNIDYKRTFKN